MPFTNPVPDLVLPRSWEGRQYAAENVEDDLHLHVEFCREYRDGTATMTRTPEDIFRPMGVPPCENRRRDGERYFNWCYRCMSGFPFSHISERDKEHSRDSFII